MTARASALRFGNPCVMALLHALCQFGHLPHGFRNRDLRPHVAALLGLDLAQYSPGRLTYDLRRLRLKGLIARRPGTHRYTVATYGLQVALFHSKVYLRILRPGWPSAPPPDAVPRPLCAALSRVTKEIDRLCDQARLRPAA